MIDKRSLVKLFEEFTNKSALYCQEATRVLLTFYEQDFKKDWQIQGTVILLITFLVLMMFVKLEWNRYGPSIMGMELAKTPSYDQIDTSDFYVSPEFPDEDPLTFTKKKNQ